MRWRVQPATCWMEGWAQASTGSMCFPFWLQGTMNCRTLQPATATRSQRQNPELAMRRTWQMKWSVLRLYSSGWRNPQIWMLSDWNRWKQENREMHLLALTKRSAFYTEEKRHIEERDTLVLFIFIVLHLPVRQGHITEPDNISAAQQGTDWTVLSKAWRWHTGLACSQSEARTLLPVTDQLAAVWDTL